MSDPIPGGGTATAGQEQLNKCVVSHTRQRNGYERGWNSEQFQFDNNIKGIHLCVL